MTTTPNFGRVARLYARMRPGYLPQVFDDLIALSGIPAGGRILEIGPGTGQATFPLLERGYHVIGIEPEPALLVEAVRQLSPSANAEFYVSRFEDWPLPDEPFDLVLAATAFHWIDPTIRYVKSASALRTGGALAIINTHHVAGGTTAFFEASQTCYQAHVPGTTSGFRLPAAQEVPPGTTDLADTGLFEAPADRRYQWQATCTTTDYIDLLSTYSDHIAMPDSSRRAFFQCIAALIDGRFGGRIVKQYMTELIVARKR
jgi:SAM-dependent methyltransferase